MSHGPAASTKRSLLAGSVTSSSSATSASIRSARRAPPTTRAPAAASWRAVAAPIPLEAPVTIAVLPSSSPTARHVTLPARRRRAGTRGLCRQERHGDGLALAVLVGQLERGEVLLRLRWLELDRHGHLLLAVQPRRHLLQVLELLAEVDAVRDRERRVRRIVVGDEGREHLHDREPVGRHDLRLPVEFLRDG